MKPLRLPLEQTPTPGGMRYLDSHVEAVQAELVEARKMLRLIRSYVVCGDVTWPFADVDNYLSALDAMKGKDG